MTQLKDIELIVLRFRDLVTTPGQTIDLHQALLDSSAGYVWWGWWNKSGEVVPGDVFRDLSERIASDSLIKIMLFDRGHKQIRYANCSEIKWDPLYNPIPSPDKNQTPEYYRDQKYPAWFKLELIEDPVINSSDELSKFAYFCVDDFFDDRKSQYTPFYGKQVSGCDELQQQDRTIWFLRPFRAGDPVHVISLAQNQQFQPTHFPENYITSKSRHLLLVSDLHFGPCHGFPNISNQVHSDLGKSIESAAKYNQIEDFAGVIVSGDITWSARESEFKDARTFFQRISRSPSTLDNYSFAICPGNHDLAFTETPEVKSAAIHQSEAPHKVRQNYEALYEDLFYIKPNEYLSVGRRFLLGGHFPLELICLNSSLLEQKEGWFQGHGFVGGQQLEQVEQAFGWNFNLRQDDPDLPRPFRLVVMHHHLLPVTYVEEPMGGASFSTLLDAERLARWLARHQVDVLLHGHMHQPYYATLTKPMDVKKPDADKHTVHIIGLGSTGVNQDHRGEHSNMFGVLSAMFGAVKISAIEVNSQTEEQHASWSVTVPWPQK